jgi:hypothetical protein
MTQQKRAREVQRRERAEAKAARRADRTAAPQEPIDPGVDPQIAHLVPGPRPVLED